MYMYIYIYIHVYVYIYVFVCVYTYTYTYTVCNITEGSLEIKLPAIWTDEKAEVGIVEKEKRRRKKMQVREKVERSFFQCFVPQRG